MNQENSNNDSLREAAKKILEGVVIGEPVHHDGLTVFPLFFEQAPTTEYALLEDMLNTDQVEITEVSESGSVPELFLHNKSNKNLLLIDGEELIGAKQNRILNISILVAAGTKLTIPVSCVEQRRWHYKSRKFSSGSHAFSTVRSKMSKSVKSSYKMSKSFNSDQGEVWSEVDGLMSDIGVRSDSSSMHDGYEELKGKLDEAVEKLKLPDDAKGYIACLGGRVLSGDLFDRSETLHRKWSRLSQGSLIESMRYREKPAPSDPEVVKKFLADVIASVTDTYESPGLGVGVHIESEAVTGNALVNEGVVLHMSMFPDAD